MIISGSSGVANDEVNHSAPSNSSTDNTGAVAQAVFIPEQILSAVNLSEQKRINERQICAAENPEHDDHNPIKKYLK